MLHAISLSPHLVKDRPASQMLAVRLPVSGHVQNVTMEGGLYSGQLILSGQIFILAKPLYLNSNRQFCP